MAHSWIGWDVGGAHLKAVALDDQGVIQSVIQQPCPLWQGLDQLDASLDRAIHALALTPQTQHAITMTGELADNFESREHGVMAITGRMTRRFGSGRVQVFAGHAGFVKPNVIGAATITDIASANWLASGLWSAACLDEALFIDVGSTTTDLLLISNHRVESRGYTDHDRMRYDELLYTGVARTPAMTLARRVPLNGGWINVMAEHFATTADVYRLTGELPEYADQLPSADNGRKTVEGSQLRLARLVGMDAGSMTGDAWRTLARFLRERQLSAIQAGVAIQLSRGLLKESAPLLGAGVGRFLVREIANRLGRPFIDFNEFLPTARDQGGLCAADCGPASAVALMAIRGACPA